MSSSHLATIIWTALAFFVINCSGDFNIIFTDNNFRPLATSGQSFVAPGQSFVAPGQSFVTPNHPYVPQNQQFVTPNQISMVAANHLVPRPPTPVVQQPQNIPHLPAINYPHVVPQPQPHPPATAPHPQYPASSRFYFPQTQYPFHFQRLNQHIDNINIVYTLGVRTMYERLVAHGVKAQHFPTIQNSVLVINYPAQGVGAQITYIHIQVRQSSTLGQAYVIRGGLHQRSISIAIEFYNTNTVTLSANIFGV